MDEESRKQAIAELIQDPEAQVLRATPRFVVLWANGACRAPDLFERMEGGGWAFVANVGLGCPMFRKAC